MRFVPLRHLKGEEKLAVSITNANMQTLVRAGSIMNAKLIERLSRYGIHSVYIDDDLDSNNHEVHDTIEPLVRNQSIQHIKSSFDRFESRVKQQKKILRYGDSGSELFEGIKNISKELINEIMCSKNTKVAMNDIKTTSDYTYQHSINVAVLSLIIGSELGLSTKELEDLTYGALLIDVGISWIDDTLLFKKEKLTTGELDHIKEHVHHSYKHINNNTLFNAHVKSIILHHHERIDGSGYPNHLISDDIHPLAKIVMIADVYDALTSDRPHREAYKQHEAIEYIMAQADNLFDFKIATVFARKIVPYPVGTYVELSNKQQGIITRNNPDNPLRPIIRTFGKSSYTNKNDVQMDLLKTNNVIIEKIIYNLS